MSEFSRIVITGGPCGGKTSVLAYLQQELPEHGVFAITVPEAARMLLQSGVQPGVIGSLAFQEAILKTQLFQEDLLLSLLRNDLRSYRGLVLLCDRGTMDNRAYVDEDDFNHVLEKNGWNIPDLRDKRYEAVIHLVTAADGAESFYIQDLQRRETAVQARALDQNTQHAWVGHPHLSLIGNDTDFEGKKHKTLATVLHHLGMPVPLERERKFLINTEAVWKLPEHAQRITIEQVYLPSGEEGVEERVRRRSQGTRSVCFRTRKKKVSDTVREEREWQISLDEYLYESRTAHAAPRIKKHRWCFLYDGQYFEFDDFSPMGLSLCMVEIELTSEDAEVRFPSWMPVLREVTGDPAYANSAIARRL